MSSLSVRARPVAAAGVAVGARCGGGCVRLRCGVVGGAVARWVARTSGSSRMPSTHRNAIASDPCIESE